jgi:arabinoxylan arabinofuranohydrolase
LCYNSVNKVALTTAGFGTRSGNAQRPTTFEEGPWFYKRGSLYYMIYAANCCSEDIRYSTSTGPTGPWTYRGVIMAAAGGSFTNHPGIVDFQGSSYFFYHNGALPGGGGYTRSVSVERFVYNSDGTIPTLKMTTAGPPQIGTLNPYVRVEAETMAFESGVETEVASEGGVAVSFINNGDYIKVRGVAFGTGAKSFSARVSSATSGGKIEVRLGSATGTLVGTCTVAGTGSWSTWATVSCPISGATGTQDLFLRFTGGSDNLFNFNWWQFSNGSGTTVPTSTAATTKSTTVSTTTNAPTSSPTGVCTSRSLLYASLTPSSGMLGDIWSMRRRWLHRSNLLQLRNVQVLEPVLLTVFVREMADIFSEILPRLEINCKYYIAESKNAENSLCVILP